METVLCATGRLVVCTWAQDECPADLHMAQPNVPVSKTGHIPPACCASKSNHGSHLSGHEPCVGSPPRLHSLNKCEPDLSPCG
jgi:hypothetical protein